MGTQLENLYSLYFDDQARQKSLILQGWIFITLNRNNTIKLLKYIRLVFI